MHVATPLPLSGAPLHRVVVPVVNSTVPVGLFPVTVAVSVTGWP